MHAVTTSHESRPSTAIIPVLDPATGEAIGEIPAGDAATADAAARAARAAQPAWARRPAAERGALLKEAALRTRSHLDELAELQRRENGRPPDESRAGVEAGLNAIEQYAELGPLHRGRSLCGAWGATDLMVHEPRGVVALLVPWNDPIAIACGQLAACLVTGNTVVLKPSEKTPLSTIRLVELLGLPGDVLGLLLGDERAGRPLAAHPEVDLVIHTGSVATGRELAALCAPDLRKALLELGGKDPLVVDAGLDPVWAAEQAAAGAFANAGQLCTSVERIYVHESLADAFTDALVARARETQIGPLIDQGQREVVHRHVSEAVDAGAALRAGGRVPDLRPGGRGNRGALLRGRARGGRRDGIRPGRHGAHAVDGPRAGSVARAARGHGQGERGVGRRAGWRRAAAPRQRDGLRLRPRAARRGDADQGRPHGAAAGLVCSPG
jgi:succinate-semialdehyde dehydrogenase/glutarate-semialdehyde dehydrogenase